MNKYYVVECLYDQSSSDNRKRMTKEQAIKDAKVRANRDSDGDNFGVFELVLVTNRPDPNVEVLEVTA